MTKVLSDNPEHIERLCELLDLGAIRAPLSRVAGGFHHCMWRLETQTGCFAIKQLADDMDMNDAATVAQINATEITAREFSLSLIHISEPTRRTIPSRMPSSA